MAAALESVPEQRLNVERVKDPPFGAAPFSAARDAQKMLPDSLQGLRSTGLEVSDERIDKLCVIVATHDLPYIRSSLTRSLTRDEIAMLADPEFQVIRDADRAFVPSALFFWKDHIAHYNDAKYLANAERLGMSMEPKEFLLARMAFFYERPDGLPQGWDYAAFR